MPTAAEPGYRALPSSASAPGHVREQHEQQQQADAAAAASGVPAVGAAASGSSGGVEPLEGVGLSRLPLYAFPGPALDRGLRRVFSGQLVDEAERAGPLDEGAPLAVEHFARILMEADFCAQVRAVAGAQVKLHRVGAPCRGAQCGARSVRRYETYPSGMVTSKAATLSSGLSNCTASAHAADAFDVITSRTPPVNLTHAHPQEAAAAAEAIRTSPASLAAFLHHPDSQSVFRCNPGAGTVTVDAHALRLAAGRGLAEAVAAAWPGEGPLPRLRRAAAELLARAATGPAGEHSMGGPDLGIQLRRQLGDDYGAAVGSVPGKKLLTALADDGNGPGLIMCDAKVWATRNALLYRGTVHWLARGPIAPARVTGSRLHVSAAMSMARGAPRVALAVSPSVSIAVRCTHAHTQSLGHELCDVTTAAHGLNSPMPSHPVLCLQVNYARLNVAMLLRGFPRTAAPTAAAPTATTTASAVATCAASASAGATLAAAQAPLAAAPAAHQAPTSPAHQPNQSTTPLSLSCEAAMGSLRLALLDLFPDPPRPNGPDPAAASASTAPAPPSSPSPAALAAWEKRRLEAKVKRAAAEVLALRGPQQRIRAEPARVQLQCDELWAQLCTAVPELQDGRWRQSGWGGGLKELLLEASHVFSIVELVGGPYGTDIALTTVCKG